MRELLLTLGLAISLGPTVARADSPAPRPRVERRSDGKVVCLMPPILVEGKVHRPAAFVVLPHPQVSYAWPELERPRPTPPPPPENR
jgi:hypothetical protein